MSTIEFAKNQSLIHTVHFGIGFDLYKGPESTFSEGPSPGLGPLHKICHLQKYQNILLP